MKEELAYRRQRVIEDYGTGLCGLVPQRKKEEERSAQEIAGDDAREASAALEAERSTTKALSDDLGGGEHGGQFCVLGLRSARGVGRERGGGVLCSARPRAADTRNCPLRRPVPPALLLLPCATPVLSSGTIVSSKRVSVAREKPRKRFPSLYLRAEPCRPFRETSRLATQIPLLSVSLARRRHGYHGEHLLSRKEHGGTVLCVAPRAACAMRCAALEA